MPPIDRVLSLAGGLVPGPEAHPDKQYFWRLRVGMVLCATFLGLICVTALAFGRVPAVFDGFARNDALQSVVGEMRAARVSILDGQLLDIRSKNCKATTSEARTLYWTRIQELSAERLRLAGSPWQMPPCDAL